MCFLQIFSAVLLFPCVVLAMNTSASFPVLILENNLELVLSKEKNGYKIASPIGIEEIYEITYLAETGVGFIKNFLGDMALFSRGDTNLILPYNNENEVQVSMEPVADGKLKMTLTTIEALVGKEFGNHDLIIRPVASKRGAYYVDDVKSKVLDLLWNRETNEVQLTRNWIKCEGDKLKLMDKITTNSIFGESTSQVTIHFNDFYNIKMVPINGKLTLDLQQKDVTPGRNEYNLNVYYYDQQLLALKEDIYPYVTTAMHRHEGNRRCIFGIYVNMPNKTFDLIDYKRNKVVKSRNNYRTVLIDVSPVIPVEAGAAPMKVPVQFDATMNEDGVLVEAMELDAVAEAPAY